MVTVVSRNGITFWSGCSRLGNIFCSLLSHWPCSAETWSTRGHHTVWNMAFPRVFHTMQRFTLTPSPERSMCRGSSEGRSHAITYLYPELYPQVIMLFFPKQAVFSLRRAPFLSCQDVTPASPGILTLCPHSQQPSHQQARTCCHPKNPLLKIILLPSVPPLKEKHNKRWVNAIMNPIPTHPS